MSYGWREVKEMSGNWARRGSDGMLECWSAGVMGADTEPQQVMRMAGVADIDFGSIHLPFAQVLEPRAQLAHHENQAVNAGFSWC
jgi:hypothetical protein